MVSIIIPTYNREKEITRAISSILRQTYSKYEIIIVDDGSTDSTQQVIGKIEDSRIRYIKLDQNQGVAHARNVGIQEAKYDYIAFLDSDDEWLEQKLELQMCRMLEASKKVGFVYCRMSGITRDGSSRFVCPLVKYGEDILDGNMFQSLLIRNVIGTPTMLVRRECLEQSGGFKESLMCLEDWELILRIAKNYEIEFVDEILVEVHKTMNSVSTNIAGYLITRCYIVSLYRKEFIEMGVLERISKEITEIAQEYGIEAEIRELLRRDFEL